MLSSNYLGKSTITSKDLKELADLHCVNPKRVVKLGPDEMVLKTREGYVTVFFQFFEGDLRFPWIPFIGDVLKYFEVEI